MKYRSIKILILLIIMLLFCFDYPLVSNATTIARVYLQKNKETIENGEEVEISFHIENQKTSSYFARIYFDEMKLEYVSGPENVVASGNEIKLLWYDVQGGSKAKHGELGKIIFRAKEKGLANFVIDGEFYSEKGQLMQTSFKNLQIQIGKDEETNLERQASNEHGDNMQSNNANLQALRINIEGMIPNFQNDIYNYDLTISNDVSSIEVLAIAENPNAQVEVIGNTRYKRRIKLNKDKSSF